MKVKMDLQGKPQHSGLQVLLRNAQKSQAGWVCSDQEPENVIWMTEKNG